MRLDRKILIDTSVMVDLLRGVEMAMNWIDGVEPKNRCLSFITVAELTAGCRNKEEQKKLELELREYVLLYLDVQSCRKGIEWYKTFHFMEVLKEHGLPFYEYNEQDFERDQDVLVKYREEAVK